MLDLSYKVKLNKETIESPNIAGKFSHEDLLKIGEHVFNGYDADQSSRSKWLVKKESLMDLAMQITKTKSFPWPDCSNVAFPLLTIATLQFHSFAYPEIIQGDQVVRYRNVGHDPEGKKTANADVISKHMSYQLLEEDTAWEEQHDRLLINIPVVGCAFKKTYYAGDLGHNISELVLAKDLVMDYYAKSTETCSRKTHIKPLTRNDIYFRVKTKAFVDCLQDDWYASNATGNIDGHDRNEDSRTGIYSPISDQDTPFIFLEQHCWIDLDDDGYAEPYIITIEAESKQVVRIVCRFEREEDIVRLDDGTILKINATEYFTKYGFIPSPDGSIYDMGIGDFLGPLNECASSLVNQLIDAGTMANKAGGFIGKGMKMRGGVYTFSPLEWKVVNSTGDDLKKSIFPLPVREPSNVLLQLLQLIIQYANRVPGSTEAANGENPGQNTPAETHRTSVEQSLKLYNAIFKRIWRSMRDEFKKLYLLNARYLPEMSNGGLASKQDYMGDPSRICPVADPHILSDSMRMAQAQALAQRSTVVNGYNRDAVEKNLLKELRIDNAEVFYPGPGKVPPLPNPKAMVEQMKMQEKQMRLQFERQKFVMDLLEEKKLNSAKIDLLKAQATRVLSEIKEGEREHTLAAFEASINAMESHNDMLNKRAELMMSAMEKDYDQQQSGNHGAGVPGLEGPSSNQAGNEPS